ncbi:MAG TPA: LLM class flavin-dependent oxidoreductase [Solirubrobacteraceae bacterium]
MSPSLRNPSPHHHRRRTDDLLQGGWPRAGAGTGSAARLPEQLVHVPPADPAEEQIGLLRRLFTEPVVDFTGRFDRIDRAALVPRPAHPIPIWLGGSSEPAYDRAARLADGFIFIGGDIDRTIDAWKRLRDRAHRVGRSVEEFAGEYVVRPQGAPGDLMADIDAWREAGGTHLSVVTMGLGLDSTEGHIDYLASVADAVSLSGRLQAG